MTIQCICLYCDHKWKPTYNWELLECSKCGSKNPRKKKLDEETVIDYYKGCPAFPAKPLKVEQPKVDTYDGYFY